MSIKFKILLYFSTLTITLVGAVLVFVYTLFYDFRDQSFREEQTVEIETTLNLLTVQKKIDQTMVESIDSTTINNLYDEKLLIFDDTKKPIYSSIGTTEIPDFKEILNQLSDTTPRIDRKDNQYDVVGVYVIKEGKVHYGICKAFDDSGYLMTNYLRKVLIFCFLGISITLFILLYYLSGQITQSILLVTKQIKNYDFGLNAAPIQCKNNRDEIALLVKRFNELMDRMNQAYLFQKHAVHHISHELKTPISVLVSNFERMEKTSDIIELQNLIKHQKVDTKSLGDIINSLLEIAKLESGKPIEQIDIRIDELLFDLSQELLNINKDFNYLIEFGSEVDDSNMLIICGNLKLLKAAFSNLMINCAKYSTIPSAKIIIKPHNVGIEIVFTNVGEIILTDEQIYLFQHFFRGENSKGVRGFGLGLVLVHKIITLHNGLISYKVEGTDKNIFTIDLPYQVKHQK